MREYTVLIIGTGFGGLSAAMALRERGIDDFCLLERRSFMGGTWMQNTYPGAQVDVQSPLYSLAGEPWDWSQMFATQDELETYTRHIIDKHGLREKTELDADVERMRWSDELGRWQVSTRDGRTFTAQFVVNASGPLSTPVVPEFAGRDTFEGPAFHTNDWDHSVDIAGKRVAIVGSGASAAQAIPAIAPEVEHLHVFQRSPHWVLPRPDRTFSPVERAVLRRPMAYRALRTGIYWGLETRVIAFKYSQRLLEFVGQRKALAHLEAQVPDPELRAKLTPTYTIGCKRILVSNTLYPALSRDNVTLHDRTDGIERVTPTGIDTAQGEHVDLDVIVWATGFDAVEGVISYQVEGRGGASLAARWADYPRAYLGTSVPDFPNLFIVTGPNTGIGHTSALFIIECQMRYIMRSIRETLDRGAISIEVKASAEDEWTSMIHREMEQTVWHTGGCTSWYQSRTGKVIAMYPGFSAMYRLHTGWFRPSHHAFG